MDKHERPYICTFDGCTHDIGFTSKGDLVRHQNSVHTSSKIYWCDHNGCSRSNSAPRKRPFARKDHLQEHVKRIHNGVYANELVETRIMSTSSAVIQRSQSQGENNFPTTQNVQTLDTGTRKRRREEVLPCSGVIEPTAQRVCDHSQEVEELRKKIAELERQLEASKAKEAASRAQVATLAEMIGQYAKQTD